MDELGSIIARTTCEELATNIESVNREDLTCSVVSFVESTNSGRRRMLNDGTSFDVSVDVVSSTETINNVVVAQGTTALENVASSVQTSFESEGHSSSVANDSQGLDVSGITSSNASTNSDESDSDDSFPIVFVAIGAGVAVLVIGVALYFVFGVKRYGGKGDSVDYFKAEPETEMSTAHSLSHIKETFDDDL